MEFETKEVNGSVVYVRKDKKVVPQREDLPGSTTVSKFTKLFEEMMGCTNNCSSCHSKCGENS